MQANIKRGKRQSTAKAFLRPSLRNGKRLTVLTEARVDRFIIFTFTFIVITILIITIFIVTTLIKTFDVGKASWRRNCGLQEMKKATVVKTRTAG